MKKGFNNLKIASIINFVTAALFYSIFPKYSLILVIIGFITLYFTSFDINKLNKSKGWLIFIGIILTIINFISAIFTLIGYDCIQSYLKENQDKLKKEEEIDKDIKRIDLLLKLGIGMVVISGILFATTSWNVTSNLLKLILLLILGTIFIGLSIFSEKKLKIKKTTYSYWLLGCAFYIFTWVAVCHFEYFGSLFSYTGTLYDLAYLTTYLIATILLFITSNKFDNKRLLYFVYAGIYLIIYHFLNYIGIDFMIIMLIITLINLVCNLLVKKESDSYLSKVSIVVSYFIIYPILDNYHAYMPILVFITALANIINLSVISLKTNDFINNLLIPIMSYIYVYIGISRLGLEIYSNLLFAFIFSIISIFIRFTKKDKNLYMTTNQIIYTIGILIFYFNSVGNDLELVLVNVIYLITNLINGINLEKKETRNIDYKLQPIPVTLLVFSTCEIIDNNFTSISVMTTFSLVSIIYGLMYTFTKDKHKNIYKVLFLLSVILNVLINFSEENLVSGIIILISSIYLFIKTYLDKKEDKSVGVLTYIVMLLSINQISSLIGNCLMPSYEMIISSILTILIYIILVIIFRKKNPYEVITNIALVIPMYNLIDGYIYDYNLSLVLENIVQFYILYLIVKYICKNNSSKGLLTLLGIIFIIIQVIFTKGIYTGIYVGIVGVIVIVLGYLDKVHKSLFNVGIIITIINIIYQLQNLWGTIPFWLYLLVVGLGLIIFVTYKESKKIENKKDN